MFSFVGHHPHLFLQAADLGNIQGALQVLEQARNTSADIFRDWLRVQNEVLINNGLWDVLLPISQLFASMSFGFFAVREFRRLQQAPGNVTVFDLLLRTVVFVLPVAALLANNASFLLEIVYFIRNAGFAIVNSVIDHSIGTQTVEQLFQQAGNNAQARQEVLKAFADCKDDIGAALLECVEENADDAEQALNNLGIGDPGFVQATVENIKDAVQSSTDPVSAAADVISRTLFGASAGLLVFQGVMYVIQAAFVHAIHAALLFSLLYARIPVSLALAPFGPGILYGWFSSIVGLFSTMLGFNIILAFIAALFAEADPNQFNPNNDVVYAVFLGVFAPLLSGAVGVGSAVGTFQSLRVAQAAVVGGALTAVGAAAQAITSVVSIQAAAALRAAGSVAPVASTSPSTSSVPSRIPPPLPFPR